MGPEVAGARRRLRARPAVVTSALALAASAAALVVGLACSTGRARVHGGPAATAATAATAGGAVAYDAGSTVRIALATADSAAVLSATDAWRLYERNGGDLLVRGSGGDRWTIERRGDRLRAVREDGTPTAWSDGPLLARVAGEDGLVTWKGRRYRGELAIYATARGLVVVNRLPMEDYLRGVVPLEIGGIDRNEMAAAEAQAVAARSYAYTHLGSRGGPYDLLGSVSDQVYGGVAAERAITDQAVANTAGLVLKYGGRVVNAPFHSTCGGSTAEMHEVWTRAGDEPYLRAVSDRIPGTERFYCDIAPRFRWTRTLSRGQLQQAVERYLSRYAVGHPDGPFGQVREVEVARRTETGRVGALNVVTDRGRYVLRGNDIRYVLRAPGGEMLNSTYFSVEPVTGDDGRLLSLTLRGGGYGHGIGMCQWGAIGRARAGQDFRTILETYYPGTTVGPVE